MNSFYYWLNGYEIQRKRLLTKAPEGPLKDFLSVPFPEPDTAIDQCKILSVDFETTGLNAQQDKLLSVGFVELANNQISLASCYHQVIKTQGELTASNVVIHQITDDIKDQGESLAYVVKKLLAALAGKVMLVHFSRIEKQFLTQACLELYGLAPVFPIIDTLVLIKNRFDKHHTPYDPSSLRLSNLRDYYQLPQHFAHNALSDAIATAELLLAETANRSAIGQPLKNFLM
jgi:DNA polymerase-3 subunit epsilon